MELPSCTRRNRPRIQRAIVFLLREDPQVQALQPLRPLPGGVRMARKKLSFGAKRWREDASNPASRAGQKESWQRLKLGSPAKSRCHVGGDARRQVPCPPHRSTVPDARAAPVATVGRTGAPTTISGNGRLSGPDRGATCGRSFSESRVIHNSNDKEAASEPGFFEQRWPRGPPRACFPSREKRNQS